MPYSNPEKRKEHFKQYYQKNKEKIKNRTRKYYQEHRDKMLEYKRQQRVENKEEIKEYKKQYYLENLDKIKRYQQDNKEKIKNCTKEYYQKHRKTLIQYGKQYALEHLDEKKLYNKKYNKSEVGKIKHKKYLCKRFKEYGFNLLYPNIIEEPIDYHHFNPNNNDDVLAIPRDLHKLYHCGRNLQNHKEMLLSIVFQLYPDINNYFIRGGL